MMGGRPPPPPNRSLQNFVAELHQIHHGPLHQVQALLSEMKSLHNFALREVDPQVEAEALERIAECAKRASAEGASANRRLKALTSEVQVDDDSGPTGANLREQQFRCESAYYQELMQQVFRAQQEFKCNMETKVRRRLAQPGSSGQDDAIISAALAAQRTQERQDTRPLVTLSELGEMDHNLEELLNLAKAAEDLNQLFQHMETVVQSQGDYLNDIESVMARNEQRAIEGRRVLQRAVEEKKQWHRRWCFLAFFLLVAIVVVILILVYK